MSEPTKGINTGYVLGQLAQALQTQQSHPDAATRERAAAKADRWVQVFEGMLSGNLRVGSRTPVANTPAWATLEVVKGGFANGNLLAAGPLQPHEIELLGVLPKVAQGTERGAINAFYLSEAGFAALRAMLETGNYRIAVPEEGALLVVAALASHGDVERARALLDELAPFMNQLRFYPAPAERPQEFGEALFRQDVAQSAAQLRAVRELKGLAAEREAVLLWMPLYDQAVALFAETVAGEMPHVPLGGDGAALRRPNGHLAVEGGWPCQSYPAGWAARARALLAEYRQERKSHTLAKHPDDKTQNFALLRGFLERCAKNPRQLTGREVGLIRSILAGYARRRGLPGSERHRELRAEQRRRLAAPTRADLARVLAARLAPLPQDEGLEDPAALLAPITADEAQQFGAPTDTPFPPTLARKLERSLAAPLETLVERRILPSGEALARVVPQLSAQVSMGDVWEPGVQRLARALYTAFRRRRSLLLLNLEHQVTFEELPWVAAIAPFRSGKARVQDDARATLRRVAIVALGAFPQQIIPNMLLREVTALAGSAGIEVPLVEEVAADIFMGTFTAKYLRAAQWAGMLLEGTLYERYYGLPYARVRAIDDVTNSKYGPPTSDAFVKLCYDLTGNVAGSGSYVARNGTVIEQEQILTTHNLAVLFDALALNDQLEPRLGDLARQCFTWVCQRLQSVGGPYKSKLRAVKNSAYAWRQMLFFLALMPEGELASFLAWAEQHLGQQPAAFAERFRPALDGLLRAALGEPIEPPARRFLGWAVGGHWLLA